MSAILKKRVPATKRDTNLEEPPNQWRFFVNWLFDSLMPGVPVLSTVGASSLKSSVSVWRGVVFVAFVVAMMAIFASNQVQAVEEYFAGTVTDQDGNNISPATVRINEVEKQTDRSGSFGFHVERADRYVINVTEPGYALVSQIEPTPNINLGFTLKKAEVYQIDPSQASEVEDSRGTRIKLPASALVDQNGNLPTVPINATVYTYDLANEAIPGDMGGINTAGDDVYMESAGAFWAEFTDASGNKYNLADDQKAIISVPAPKTNSDLRELTLWRYNEKTGKWEEQEGSAQPESGRLVGTFNHFSAVNFDWEKQKPACVKFEIDESLFDTFGTPLDVKAVATAPSSSIRIRNFTLSDSGPHVLYNLPANTIVDFYIPPSSSSPYATIDAEAAWGGTGIPTEPYDDCNGSIILTPPSACTTPPSGMVAWWPFDENPIDITAHEIAGYGGPYDGTYVNNPAHYSGFVDGGVLFNGISSSPLNYVEVPNHANLNFGTGDFSIDAWILHKEGASGVETIIDKREQSPAKGYSFFLYNGQLGFQLADAAGSSSTCSTVPSTSACTNYILSDSNLADSKWHHVAVTIDRDNSTGGIWYIDGAPQSTFNPAYRIGSLDNTSPLRIARHSFSESNFFRGVIDEVELFNRVLTASEVEAIYNAGEYGKCKLNIPPPAFDLTVSKTGDGTVISDDGGINCGADCNENYASGTLVVLTATPTTDYTFTGWTGDCSGTETCQVTMNEVKNVTANFDTVPTIPLVVNVTGRGTVGTYCTDNNDSDCVEDYSPSPDPVVINHGGIYCSSDNTSDCAKDYPLNQVVTLSARLPFQLDCFMMNSCVKFAGWTGDCVSAGTNSTVEVTMDSAKTCTATFESEVVACDSTTWLNKLIVEFKNDLDSNPPHSIYKYDYYGETVYYVPPQCCDQYSTLYDACEKEICAPDGGITGTGDGKCSDFFKVRKNEKLVFSQEVKHDLTVSKTGDGTIISDDGSINCGTDCNENYASGTQVVLTAKPATGSIFKEWGRACSGTTPVCQVKVSQAQNVSVLFMPSAAQNTYLWSNEAEWKWAIKTASQELDYAGDYSGITTDGLDNIYVTGNLVCSTNQRFIAKYHDVLSPANLMWQETAAAALCDGTGTTSYTRSTIASDDSGNIYITGSGKVAKYNDAGTSEWTETITGNIWFHDIATYGDYVYVTGLFSGSLPYVGGPILSTSSSEALFVAKYEAATGNLVQVKIVAEGHFINETQVSIAVDEMGIYVTGSFKPTVTFVGISPSLTSSGGSDVFIAKINNELNSDWVEQIEDSDSWLYSHAIATDGTGNVYVTGKVGNFDMFIAKYDSSGTSMWENIGGYPNKVGKGITVSCGSVYVTGYIDRGWQYSPELVSEKGTRALPHSYDVFVDKYDINGTLLGTKETELSSYGSGKGGRGTDIAVEDCHNIYVSGVLIGGTTNFGDSYSLSGEGYFVAKIENDVDVWIEDTPYNHDSFPDTGEEPDDNMDGLDMWRSRGIWVRNSNDCTSTDYGDHQNPEFGQINYICVRVQNRGNITADNTTVNIYWANPSTGGLGWLGGGINWQPAITSPFTIPNLEHGDSQIVTFDWEPPNPVGSPLGHFCLLARLENSEDPMTYEEMGWVGYNARNNNNIAWRNVYIVNLVLDEIPPIHFIARKTTQATLMRLEIDATNEKGESIALPPEVTTITLGGLEKLRLNGSTKGFEMQKTRDGGLSAKMTGEKASIGINMAKDEEHSLSLKFGATSLTSKKASGKYYVHVKQYEGEELVGGITYELRPPKPKPLDIGFTSSNFGNVSMGKSSVAQPFTLSNSGDVSLPIGTIKVVDEFGNGRISQEFIINKDDCSGKNIPASAKCEFLTEFKPKSEGEKKATVLVPYSDEFGNPDTLSVPLAGIGKPATTSGGDTGTEQCQSGNVINGVCSDSKPLITDTTIEAGDNVSDGTITGIVDNKGMISQVTIDAEAVVKGGKVSGHVTNNGRLGDFEFVGASLTGGELFGNIINNSQVGGVFIDVRLAANTSIDGGAMQGVISGDASAPATLKNVRVKASSRLSNVVLGEGVQLPEDVEFGEGIRFTDPANIPDGELMGLLPVLSADAPEGVTHPRRADFTADILEPSEGILTVINELPLFKDNGWVLSQNKELGYFEVTIDNVRYAEIPFSVIKTTAGADMLVLDAQSLSFITGSGLDVLTNPALQAPSALQTALGELFNLSEFTLQANGNLSVPAGEGVWYSARPDWSSLKLDDVPESVGLSLSVSPHVNGASLASLVFADNEEYYRQNLFPSLADPEALAAVAGNISTEAYGLVNFTLNGKAYRGVVDYLVTQTDTTTNTLQVEPIADVNGDGIDDVMLTYPNGEQQIVFVK